MTEPSGELRLRAGDATATIDVERGGRLASVRLGDRELLLGAPAAGDRSIRWGAFLMAPWPGRLEDGRFEWRGRTFRLPPTHGRHAIHGLLWSHVWRVESASPASATLSIDLRAAGWPMAGTVRQAFRVTPDGLQCVASIEADEAMPAALGWHPWFLRGGADGAGLRLRVEADSVLVTRRMIPTGSVTRLTGVRDLRSGPVLGRRRLDHAYVGATSPARLEWPDLVLEITFGPEASTIVVHTPPRAICVEPQTAWPNALALPRNAAERAGVRFLDAGERLESTMTLRWREVPAARQR